MDLRYLAFPMANLVAISTILLVLFEVLVLVVGHFLERYRARKERKRKPETQEDSYEGRSESAVFLDHSLGIARGRSSLQPQRRTDVVVQIDLGEDDVGRLVRQPVPESPDIVMLTPYRRVEESVPERPPTPPNSEVGVEVPSTITVPPQRHSLALSDTGRRSQFSLMSSSPASSHRMSSTSNRTSVPSTMDFKAPHRIPIFPTSQSAHQRPVSTSTRASQVLTMYSDSVYPVSTLPSYPGTARSASPPGYSNLSRSQSGRTTRTSLHGPPHYAESLMEPMPDLAHLEEHRRGV